MKMHSFRHTWRQSTAACLVIGSVCGLAYANPGAAVMATAVHVAIGSWAIGLIEAAVAKAFGARWRVFLLVVIANVISAFIGMAFANSIFDVLMGGRDHDPLDRILPVTWASFLLLVAMGLVIEFPAFLLAFPRPWLTVRAWKRPFAAMLAGAVVTNGLLVLYYSTVWADSLVTDFRKAQPAEIARHSLVEGELPWVYFIASDERTVRRVRLDGTGEELVATASSGLDRAVLCVRPSEEEGFDLCVNNWRDDERRIGFIDAGGVVLLDERPLDDGHVGLVQRGIDSMLQMVEKAHWLDDADLRPLDGRHVQYVSSFDGLNGISVRRPEMEPQSIALSNGFAGKDFTPLYVSVLPGETLVFELNRVDENSTPGGIYLLNIETGERARLNSGRSPVVMYARRKRDLVSE